MSRIIQSGSIWLVVVVNRAWAIVAICMWSFQVAAQQSYLGEQHHFSVYQGRSPLAMIQLLDSIYIEHSRLKLASVCILRLQLIICTVSIVHSSFIAYTIPQLSSLITCSHQKTLGHIHWWICTLWFEKFKSRSMCKRRHAASKQLHGSL